MLKKHLIVAITADKATPKCILKDMVVGGYKVNNSSDNYQYHTKNFIPKDIYILSDEEVKKGDWILTGPLSIPMKVTTKTIDKGTNGFIKIIATTNKSIREIVTDKSGETSYPYPTVSSEFIKKFCEFGGMDEVMVEYEKYCTHLPCYDYPEGLFDYKLKVMPDNTINILTNSEAPNEPNKNVNDEKDLYDSLCNLLGAFNNPVVKRKLNGLTDFQQEAINIAEDLKIKLEQKFK